MLHLLSLLAMLFELAFACPLVTNDTENGNQGYFGPWFGNEKSGLWPKNDKGINVVPYCYLDQKSFDKLSTQVGLGWAIWYSKIDDPGAEHGHALVFERALVPGGANPWCRDGEGKWNPDIPKHALAIVLGGDAEIGGTTTVGHTPNDKNNEPGWHYMKMGGAATDWDYAHELGHAFGVLHEHQRPDRDNHVFYNCEILFGYAEVLYGALQHGYTQGDLCNAVIIASKYNFCSREFTMNGPLVDGASGSKEYDIDSIIHYTSKNFANPEVYKHHPRDANFLPLVRKDGDGNKHIIAEPEPFPDFDVTDLYAQGIKAMYPWTGKISGKVSDAAAAISARLSTLRTALGPSTTGSL